MRWQTNSPIEVSTMEAYWRIWTPWVARYDGCHRSSHMPKPGDVEDVAFDADGRIVARARWSALQWDAVELQALLQLDRENLE